MTLRLLGDAADSKGDTASRYAIDPASAAFTPCPAESPTYNAKEPNPCGQLTMPQAAPMTATQNKTNTRMPLSPMDAAMRPQADDGFNMPGNLPNEPDDLPAHRLLGLRHQPLLRVDETIAHDTPVITAPLLSAADGV